MSVLPLPRETTLPLAILSFEGREVPVHVQDVVGSLTRIRAIVRIEGIAGRVVDPGETVLVPSASIKSLEGIPALSVRQPWAYLILHAGGVSRPWDVRGVSALSARGRGSREVGGPHGVRVMGVLMRVEVAMRHPVHEYLMDAVAIVEMPVEDIRFLTPEMAQDLKKSGIRSLSRPVPFFRGKPVFQYQRARKIYE